MTTLSTGIGSESIPGREFPDQTIYTDETTGNMYFVPFVADDGRVGYRVGFAVEADGPDGDRASVESFVYMNPSTSVDVESSPDVFIYTGTAGTPDQDEPVVFIALDDEALGIEKPQS